MSFFLHLGHLVWSFIIGDGEGFTTTKGWEGEKRKTAKFNKKKLKKKLAYTSTERTQSTRVECA